MNLDTLHIDIIDYDFDGNFSAFDKLERHASKAPNSDRADIRKRAKYVDPETGWQVIMTRGRGVMIRGSLSRLVNDGEPYEHAAQPHFLRVVYRYLVRLGKLLGFRFDPRQATLNGFALFRDWSCPFKATHYITAVRSLGEYDNFKRHFRQQNCGYEYDLLDSGGRQVEVFDLSQKLQMEGIEPPPGNWLRVEQRLMTRVMCRHNGVYQLRDLGDPDAIRGIWRGYSIELLVEAEKQGLFEPEAVVYEDIYDVIEETLKTPRRHFEAVDSYLAGLMLRSMCPDQFSLRRLIEQVKAIHLPVDLRDNKYRLCERLQRLYATTADPIEHQKTTDLWQSFQDWILSE
jgi:hypothetical protein